MMTTTGGWCSMAAGTAIRKGIPSARRGRRLGSIHQVRVSLQGSTRWRLSSPRRCRDPTHRLEVGAEMRATNPSAMSWPSRAVPGGCELAESRAETGRVLVPPPVGKG